jgi:hypothetical protein
MVYQWSILILVEPSTAFNRITHSSFLETVFLNLALGATSIWFFLKFSGCSLANSLSPQPLDNEESQDLTPPASCCIHSLLRTAKDLSLNT